MGTLYLNGVYWYFGYNKNGKQYPVSTGIKGELSEKRKKEIKKTFENRYEQHNINRRFSLKLDNVKNDYINIKTKEVQRGERSQNTLRSDNQHLKTFCNYVRDKYGRINIEDVNHDVIEKYMNYRFDVDGCNKTTVGNNVRGIQGFFRYCVRQGHIDVTPTSNIKIPQPYKRTTDQIPTKMEFNKIKKSLNSYIKEYLKDDSDFDWIRLISWFQIRTGMRLGEVLIIKWNQNMKRDVGEGHSFSYVYLNSQKSKLVIYFKKKRREIPIKGDIKKVLVKIKKDSQSKDYVFENNKTKTFFNTTSFSRPFKKFLKNINVDSKYTSHTLRRGFVTDLLRKDKSIYKIGKLVGHSTSRITEIYGHLISTDLEDLIY